MRANRTHKGRKTQDLTGKEFDRLTVLGLAGFQNGRAVWTCRCTCRTVKTCLGISLTSHNAKSCGCLKREKLKARKKHPASVIDMPEYTAYHNMLRRCYDPSHKSFTSYGARGVTVCDAWRESFEAFFADMGSRPSSAHSLDRFPDQNGPYAPSNCRWATAEDQARNTRRNVNITYRGETRCISEWAERLGHDPHTLADRLQRYGWDVEKALTTPTRPMQSRREMPLTFRDETHTLFEWSQRLNIDEKVIGERLFKQGWDVEKALGTPVRAKDSLINYDGLSLTITQWAARLDMPAEALRKRLRRGLSLDQALTMPPRKRNN